MPNNLKPVSVSTQNGGRTPGLSVMLIVLAATLGLLLCGAFVPGYTLFSNDGPISRLMSACHRLPDTFTGAWQDLNTVGYREGGATPNLSFGLRLASGPLLFSKCYALLGLLLLGLGAWCFFRQMKLSAPACLLGGLAAALNTSFFSAACWGVVAHVIAIGLSFMAMALLADTTSTLRWPKVLLAGFAVGMAVSEGADIGALFSLLVAAFVIYQSWVANGASVKPLVVASGRVVLVAACAGFLAAQTMSVLVSTNIEGISGKGTDDRSQQKHWDWATQWSLPKKEALGFLVPGLFGYRMDTEKGGEYWGTTGRSAAWEAFFDNGKQGDQPGGFIRYGAGGIYCGTPVLLVAAWAAAQSFRRKDSVFNFTERKWLWFWLAIAFVSLLLSFGRYAPFYRLAYALPYFSTIRNPAKFTHFISFVLVILFAYGVDALWQKYLNRPGPYAGALKAGFRNGWVQATQFDRRWVRCSIAALAVALLAWLVYASSRSSLESYLQYQGFAENKSKEIAGFSIRQVGWFISFYFLACGLMAFLLAGAFSGRRAKWGMTWLGLLLFVDLGRAHQPWIEYTNYGEQCASNSIIDRLRDKPWEHRVSAFPAFFLDPKFQASFDVPQVIERREQVFSAFYNISWAQYPFPYYNVQSLDIVQMPRTPEDLEAYDEVFKPRRTGELSHVIARRWELTNTRYIVGVWEFLDFLNVRLDPGRERFRVVDRFQVVPRPGITNPNKASDLMALPATNGPLALFEFRGALPRVSLYQKWNIMTNSAEILRTLTDTNFDPHQTVLVEAAAPLPTESGTARGSGSVEFTSYAPKDLVLKAQAAAPSVLLLNDRFEPNWNAIVDGVPAPILRCNYLMRGLYLKPGTHTIEFRFQPPCKLLWVSLAADGIALFLFGFVMVAGNRKSERVPAKSPAPAAEPVSKPGPAPSVKPARPAPAKTAKAVPAKGRS